MTPGAFEETRIADATIEVLPGAKPLKHGTRVRFHQGTAEILGRVAIIGPAQPTPARAGDLPGNAGASPGLTLPAGARGFIRLRLEAPAVIARGDRYILRAYSPPVTMPAA